MKYSDDECRKLIAMGRTMYTELNEGIELDDVACDLAAAALEERLGPVEDEGYFDLLFRLHSWARHGTKAVHLCDEAKGAIRTLLRERDELKERVKELESGLEELLISADMVGSQVYDWQRLLPEKIELARDLLEGRKP